MKKTICVCLSILLLILSCPTAMAVDTAPVFTIGTAQGDPGESVDVPVTLAANSGLISCRIFVDYDADVLTLTGVTQGTDFAGEYVFSKELTADPFTVIWCDALAQADHTQSGTLCVLHFTIAADAPAGDSELALSYDAGSTFNYDLTNTVCTMQDGSVSVGGWRFSEDCTLRIYTENGMSYVTGLDWRDPYVSDYVQTFGGWSFSVTPNTMDAESTGAVLYIFNRADDCVEEYPIVVFGDIDGDGQITVTDTMEIIAVVKNVHVSAWAHCTDTTEYAESMAADINHDTQIDVTDVVDTISVIQCLAAINQLWMSEDDPYMTSFHA